MIPKTWNMNTYAVYFWRLFVIFMFIITMFVWLGLGVRKVPHHPCRNQNKTLWSWCAPSFLHGFWELNKGSSLYSQESLPAKSLLQPPQASLNLKSVRIFPQVWHRSSKLSILFFMNCIPHKTLKEKYSIFNLFLVSY